MTMSDWLKIDPRQVHVPPEVENVHGVEIQVFVSPYDIPKAIRGEYDKRERRFIIDFDYLDQEPLKELPEKHVTRVVGELSGRLRRLKIDVDALNAKTVALQVLQERVLGALDTWAGQEPQVARQHAYAAAKEAIKSTKGKVYEAFTGAR
jgi:hypothetical protein